MTKLKEVNTYTLEELKWYKFWCDSNIATKPSLDSKFKEALDENSKTEIEFDLDDLKLIKKRLFINTLKMFPIHLLNHLLKMKKQFPMHMLTSKKKFG